MPLSPYHLRPRASGGIWPWFADRAPTIVHASAFRSISTGSTAHTYGAWTQIIASTSADIGLIWWDGQASPTAAANNSVMWSLGVGAAGSEVAVMNDLPMGGNANFGAYLPIAIPSGSRLAGRVKSPSATSVARFPNWFLMSTGTGAYSVTPTSIDILGADPNNSTGTAMSGASGTWVEVVASTTKVYQSMFLVPCIVGTDTAAVTGMRFVLGTGAAGAEVPQGELAFNTTANEAFSLGINPYPFRHCGPVASGTRIAVQHNIASNPGQYGCAVVAVPYR